MKKHFLILILSYFVSLGTFAQMSGSYTVDPAQSASSGNYQSIAAAVFDLTQSSGTRPDGGPRNGPGVNGSVTISIASGTYRGQLLLTPISGSSSSNKVTFVSAAGQSAQVIIQDSATAQSNNGTVRVQGADYVTFEKVSIRTLGSNFATAIWIDSSGTDLSSHIRFENCRITARWSVTNINYCGAYINGNQSDISFVKDTFNNASCGVYFNGSRNAGNLTSNLTIDTCSFIQFSTGSDVFQPFFIRYVRGLSMVGNYMMKNGCCADRIGQIFAVRPPAQISYNRFYYSSNAGNGIELDSVNMFSDPDDFYIYNNFLQSNYGSTGRLLRIYRSARVQVVNNSLFGNGTSPDYALIETQSLDSVRHQNIVILNNMLVSNGSIHLKMIGQTPSSARKMISRCNFNNYSRLQSSFQVLAEINTVRYSSQNAIPGLLYTGSDSASLFENVGYKSTNDLHLSSNPCLIGTPISYISDDIDRDSRNSPPVIGADEGFSGKRGNNLAVVAITAPGTSFSPGTQNISYVVKNLGSNTVTSFKANYQVNGGSIYSSVQSVSLAPCDTMTVTFSGTLQYNFPSGANFLKVFTDSVNGSIDSVSTNDTLSQAFCSPLSGSYTIKPGSALGGTNFRTFQQLADALVSCGVSGPVVVDVDSALYQEHVVFGPISGNSSTNTVVIRGTSGKPEIRRKAFSGSVPYLFRVDGPSDLTFRNLAFRSDSSGQGILIQAVSGKNLRVKDCLFEYYGNAANSTSSNLMAVQISSSYTNSGNQADFDLVEVDSNSFNYGFYGVYSYLTDYLSQLKSSNNKMLNLAGTGYYLYNGTNDVQHNYIMQRSANAGNAVYLFASNPANTSYVNRISNNIIPQFGSTGIYIQSARGSSTTGFGEIYNNMIGGNTLSSSTVYGIYLSSSDRWKIYHNSIHLANSNPSTQKGIYVGGGSSSVYANQIKNNSISISNSFATNALCVDIQYRRLVDTIGGVNFNNYNNGGTGDVISIQGTVYTSSTYKVAYPNGGGSGSQYGNPGYVSSVDLHATGGQLDNKGTSVGVSKDIDGDNRSSSTPDIGADEYSSQVTQDLAMTTLVQPANSSCLGGNYNIQVRIQNAGTQQIDLTNDTANLYIEIVSPGFNYINYGPIVFTNDTLAPGSVRNITIATNVSLTEYGTYDFMPFLIWANDQNGNNDTLKGVKRDINNPVPIIYPTGSLTACPGDSVKLSGANSEYADVFQWYRNGASISGATDSVYYAKTDGYYTVNVSSPAGCKKYSDSVQVNFHTGPSGQLTSNKSGICSGDSALLTIPGGSGYSFEWKLNGNTITGAVDSFYYAKSAGQYTVKVSNSSTGCSLSSSLTLGSGSAPNTSLYSGGKTSFCQGDSLKISAMQGTGYAYQWIKDGQSIGGANDSFYYANSTGNYQVQITVSGGCTGSSSALNIVMNPLPSNVLNLRGGAGSCGQDTLYLDAQGGSGYAYVWTKDGQVITGAGDSTLMVTVAGNYQVEISTAAGCNVKTNAINVSFKPAAATPTIFGYGKTGVCAGDSMKLSAGSADAGPLAFTWLLDNQVIQGKTDSFIYASAAGKYTVKVLNGNNCEGTSAGFDVSINPIPTPTLNAGGSLTFCEGDSVVFDVVNGSQYAGITWLKDAAPISGANGTSYIARSAGKYSVKVKSASNCEGSSSDYTVVVNPSPTPVITLDMLTRELSSNLAAGNQWLLNGSPIAGATGQKHIPVANGNYQVQVTDANGCKGLSNTIAVGFVSVENTMTYPTRLYPNPAQNAFFIDSQNERVWVRMMGINGQEVGSGWLMKGQPMDISQLANGVYTIQVISQDQTNAFRLIKN